LNKLLTSKFKYVLIAVYLLCDYQAVLARIESLGIGINLLIFLVLYAVTAASLFLVAAIRNTPLRLGFAALFCAGSIFIQAYEWGTRQPFTYSAFLTMIDSRGDIADAVYQYGDVLWLAVPIGLLLFVAIALPSRSVRWPQWLNIAGPVGSVALLSALLFVRGGEGATALPAPFAPTAFTALYAGTSLTSAARAKEAVDIPRADIQIKRDIVLIVDESVSAQYLDINHADGVASGLASPPPGVAVANYGYAAAIHNCSVGANATLRYGGTRGNYKQMWAGGVSIWDYAKRAGMRTVYYDAQRTDGALQNLMTNEEKARIDQFVQLGEVPIVERDVTIAARLADHINNGQPEFIYVNKVGAHFPVHDRYPDSAILYRPFLPRGHHADQDDTGERDGFAGFDGKAQSWRRYRNSYRNTLLWNVSEFFDRLLGKADFDNATLIYTSDHGQDLHERGDPGIGTHCGTRPEQEEGLVPLVVIEGKGAKSHDWQGSLETNRNRASNYNIFPALLRLMGYTPGAVRKHYGTALFETIEEPLTFNTEYYAQLGREPVWKEIDIDRIVDPPTSDYTKP